MKRLKLSLVIISALILHGCASLKVDATGNDTNAMEFSERLVKGMSSKLDKLIVPLGAKKTETESYRSYYNKFFPVAGGQQGVRDSLSSYCTKVGGYVHEITSNKIACENDVDEIIFFYSLYYMGTYAGNIEVALTVIEPTIINNDEFIAKARELGYVSKQEKLAEALRLQEEERIKFEHYQTRMRENAKRIVESGRGTQVCSTKCRFFYIGIVTNIAGEKVQIVVQNMFLKGSSTIRSSGFQPHFTWDDPKNWHIC